MFFRHDDCEADKELDKIIWSEISTADVAKESTKK